MSLLILTLIFALFVDTSHCKDVKMSTKKKNLDIYLGEIFKQFIAIKDDDYKRSQEVFKGVFDQVKAKMGEKCNYFGKYSSQVMYAGSVYDGIKVSKLDEFDMDIVIRLPINYDEGITLENDQAGFIKLKIETAFDNLDKQQEWEKCHKVTREWRDGEKYFLQNKFRQWMHGIVQKALNDLNGQVTVNNTMYLVKYKESGPAYTLNIENEKGNEEFKLDVDLVPVIRFMYPRWPEGYRNVEETIVKDWLVVPKPNKSIPDGSMKNRCWRLSFQEFERDMMKGCQQLKTTIRLVKKLRDSLQMKDIASYYIKTLFMWKLDETKEKKYWQKGLGVLFRVMVEELYNAITNKNIPYFWHKDNNLIEKMKPTIQRLYAEKLKDVLKAIDSNDADKVASYLLTTDEFQEFKNSEFYLKQIVNSANSSMTSQLSRQESNVSLNSNSDSKDVRDSQDLTLLDLVKALNDKVTAIADDNKLLKKIEAETKASTSKVGTVTEIIKEINAKVDSLADKVTEQSEKLNKLEVCFKDERDQLNNKIEVLMDKIDIQSETLKKLEMETKHYKEKYYNVGDALAGVLEMDHNQIRLTEKEIKKENHNEEFFESSSETIELRL